MGLKGVREMRAVVFATILIGVTSMVGNSAGVDFWIEHSAQKVMRDSVKPEKPRLSASLAAALNEWESFQIVLRSDTPVSGLAVKASSLTAKSDKVKIPASAIELLRVEYVPIKSPSVPYPDPLPPLRQLDLKPGETQPIWVIVKVPRNAQPGDYRGTVTISGGGIKRIEIPISLHVWDFALPETPNCVTAFGIWMQWVARAHGTQGDETRTTDLHKKYYEFLLDHKISAYHIPVDLQSPEGRKYLEDPRMTSYVIPYTDNDDQLKKVVEYLIEYNVFKKGYFYPIDEPSTQEAYDKFTAMADRLHRIEPRSRMVAPFFCAPQFAPDKTIYDFAVGKLDIWCPNEHYFDLEKRTRPFLRARKNAGDDLWWYVCCGPGEPYANFFVEMSAMNHRMLFWHQKRENVDGLLYWGTTYWNPAAGCDDPWTSMQTVKDINPNIHGDGSLLYPGNKVGIDGPVSSLRLEVIRDGIEDFDYLCLADKYLGTDTTMTYIGKLAKSLTEYEHDPWKLEAIRRELGKAIEAARLKSK